MKALEASDGYVDSIREVMVEHAMRTVVESSIKPERALLVCASLTFGYFPRKLSPVLLSENFVEKDGHI